MPVSVCDSVLRESLDSSLQSQIVSATKKHLVLKTIEYEEYSVDYKAQTEALKSKYLVLSSSENNNIVCNGNGKAGSSVVAAHSKERRISVGPANNNSADPAPTLSGTAGLVSKNGLNKTNELPAPKRVLFNRDKVQIGWKSGTRKWQIGAGMVNVGNTCYLNSTLQALFHVPALANWLVSDTEHREQCEQLSGGQSCCIICAMSKTLLSSQTNQFPIKPFLVYSKLKLVCKHLVHGRQEDAHEFLRYLIEAMEKAYLSRFKQLNLDQYSKETTPLNQILGGYLRSTVRCLACGHLSITFQHFEDLLLDIRKANTVDEALQGYFARERLEDMGYKCESCKKKVSATKQFTLERPPIVLCIQLKRFSMLGTKLNKQVTIKPKLDLSPYVKKAVPGGSLVYRLVAMVTHLGTSQHCGHYTAIGLTESGTYYQFDDSSVKSMSLQNVLQTNAYIIFYELESATSGEGGCQNGNSSSVNGNRIPSSTMTSNSLNRDHRGSNEYENRNGNSYKPKLIEDGSGDKRENGFIGPVLPPNFYKSNNSDENKNNPPRNGTEPVPKLTIQYNNKKYPTPDFSPSIKAKESKQENGPTRALLPSMPQLNSEQEPQSTSNQKANHLTGDDPSSKSKVKSPLAEQTNGKPKSLVPYDLEITSDDDTDDGDKLKQQQLKGTASKPVENGKARKPSPFVRTNSGIWKVYDTDEDDGHAGDNSKENGVEANGVSNEDKSKHKCFPPNSFNGKVNGDKVVNELLKFDHRGYGGATIKTWSGQKSNMEKVVQEEKRMERKRESEQNADDMEMDRGKVKKVKPNSMVGRDNPGFNPFQEFQSRQQQQSQHQRPPSWVNGRPGPFRHKYRLHHRPHGNHHTHNGNSNGNRYPPPHFNRNHNNRQQMFRNNHYRKFPSGNSSTSNGYRRGK